MSQRGLNLWPVRAQIRAVGLFGFITLIYSPRIRGRLRGAPRGESFTCPLGSVCCSKRFAGITAFRLAKMCRTMSIACDRNASVETVSCHEYVSTCDRSRRHTNERSRNRSSASWCFWHMYCAGPRAISRHAVAWWPVGAVNTPSWLCVRGAFQFQYRLTTSPLQNSATACFPTPDPSEIQVLVRDGS